MYRLDDLTERRGELKQELRSEVQKQAKQRGELWDKYAKVCENDGVDPVEKLVDTIFMVLMDDSYAEEIAATEIGVSTGVDTEMREDDIEYVLDLYKKYDVFQPEGNNGFDIQDLIEKRLQVATGGPLSGLSSGEESESRLDTKLSSIGQQLDRVERRLDRVEGGEPEVVEHNSEERESELDELFGSENDESEDVEFEAVESTGSNPLTTEGVVSDD